MAADIQKVLKVKNALNNKYENKQANKKTVISGSFSGDNDSYPTVQACIDKFGEIITAWSVEPSDTKYPSEKLVKNELDKKIDKSPIAGLVKNDGSIDTNTYLTEHQDLSDYIQKSQTTGLIKNDGSIDVNTYLTEHQDLSDYIQKSQTLGLVKNDGSIDTNIYLTEHQSLSDIGGVVDVVEKSTANEGAFKTYQIKQGDRKVGVDINIPKDFLLKSGSVKTVGDTVSDKENASGLTTGDMYISLIINSKDNDTSANDNELIIPANSLLKDTTYTADEITITLTNTEFSVKSGGINTTQLANSAVTTAKIADTSITYAKLDSTCVEAIRNDTISEINDALDALAEAIDPTQSNDGN